MSRQATSIHDADHGPLVAAVGIGVGDELLTLALTHRSYAHEHGGLPTNERLEFLGDAVLGVVITEQLYRDYPDRPEGELAKLRASVVNMNALAEVARGLGPGGLGRYIRLGKGEELTGGRDKSSILADGTESLIGAIYLEHGLEPTREMILRLFAGLLTRAPRLGAGLDWKTSLQELTAAKDLGVPQYEIVGTGPDHRREFTATVRVSGRSYGSGAGTTKKVAEQKAAAEAWTRITEEFPGAEDSQVDGRAVDAGHA